MDIPFAFLGGIWTAAGYNPKSVNTRFINDYVVVMSFKFGEPIPKDGITGQNLGRIVPDCINVTRARQAHMAQVDDNVCLAEPSRFEELAHPMFDSVVGH